jgi:TolA-binding protein
MKVLVVLTLFLGTLGCASQSDVDALKNEIQQMKAQRVQHQEQLKKALDDAQLELDSCKLSAEQTFNKDWDDNSTPIKGKSGLREGNREMLNHLHEEEHRADAECQRDYENALQKAKILYGSTS